MAPPAPPWSVDMRRTASRAQRNEPSTLTARRSAMRAAVSSSSRAFGTGDPRVVHEDPQRAELVGGREQRDHVGLVAHVAAGRRPPGRQPGDTRRPPTAAAAASARYERQTSKPAWASRGAVAAPMPRLPPVTTRRPSPLDHPVDLLEPALHRGHRRPRWGRSRRGSSGGMPGVDVGRLAQPKGGRAATGGHLDRVEDDGRRGRHPRRGARVTRPTNRLSHARQERHARRPLAPTRRG